MNISVLQDKPDHLELKLTPKASWVMVVFGFLFLSSGILVVWLLGDVTHVTIDKKSLVVRQLFLNRYPAKGVKVPVGSIQKINTKLYRLGITESYEVNVATHAKEFPITLASLDGDEKKVLAKRLHAAVQTRQNLRYSSGKESMWLGLFVGLVCWLGGFVCLIFLQTSVVTAGLFNNRVEVRTRLWLLPFVARKQSVFLEDIVDIDDVIFEFRRAHSYFVLIQTKDGKKIQLAIGPMFTDESAEQVKHSLMEWLAANQR